MIIGIVTLIMSLLGVGSLEVFYINKLDVEIKKEVVNKDRKKELKVVFKESTKTGRAHFYVLDLRSTTTTAEQLRESSYFKYFEIKWRNLSVCS